VADFEAKFEWDPVVHFGIWKLICILLHEYIEIMYLLVKNDAQVNEKLVLKVCQVKEVYVGKKTKINLSYIGK